MKESKPENANFQVSLKIILKNKKGEILVLKVPDNGSMAGFYDLPGGRINIKELKEPFGKILKRELEEEIGKKVRYKLSEVPVSIGRHYYFSKIKKKDQNIFWVFFEAQYLSGEISISSEHKEYSWLRLNYNNLKKYFVRGPLEGITHYFTKKFEK